MLFSLENVRDGSSAAHPPRAPPSRPRPQRAQSCICAEQKADSEGAGVWPCVVQLCGCPGEIRAQRPCSAVLVLRTEQLWSGYLSVVSKRLSGPQTQHDPCACQVAEQPSSRASAGTAQYHPPVAQFGVDGKLCLESDRLNRIIGGTSVSGCGRWKLTWERRYTSGRQQDEGVARHGCETAGTPAWYCWARSPHLNNKVLSGSLRLSKTRGPAAVPFKDGSF